jgi:hypothetical protein
LQETLAKQNKAVKKYENQNLEPVEYNRIIAQTRKEIRILRNPITKKFKKFISALRFTDSFTYGDESKNNVYMKDVMICYMRRKLFRENDILNVFLLAKKIQELEYFPIYYRMFKKDQADQKGTPGYENINWLFFTLIDSEVSLNAGCTNEFVVGTLEILKAYHHLMRFGTIKFFLYRIMSMLVAANPENENKFVSLTEDQVLSITENKKGGLLKENGEIEEGHDSAPHFEIAGSKLDKITNIENIEDQLCKLIKKIVLNKESIFVEREREDLIALFAVFVGIKKDSYRADIEEMAKPIYYADQNVFDNKYDDLEYDGSDYESDSDEESEDVEGFNQYIQELSQPYGRAHLFDNGNMYRIKFTGRVANNEMNLMDYYEEQGKLVRQRAKVEAGIQVMRKYKKDWISYMKGEKLKGNLAKHKRERVVTKTLSSTLDDVKSKLKGIQNWLIKQKKIIDEQDIYGPLRTWTSYLNESRALFEKSFQTIGKTVNDFLDHYKVSGFSRNIFYVLERLVNVIYTWEDFSKQACELINQVEVDINDIEWEDLTEETRNAKDKKRISIKSQIQYILSRTTILCSEMLFLFNSQPGRGQMNATFSIKQEDDYYRKHLNSRYTYMYQGDRLIAMKNEDVQSKFSIGSGDDILRNMMTNYKRTRTLLNAFKTRKGANKKIAGFKQEAGVLGKKRTEGTGISVGIVSSIRARILNERQEREKEIAEQKRLKKLKEAEAKADGVNQIWLEEQEKLKQKKIKMEKKRKERERLKAEQRGYFIASEPEKKK